jgi:hypothetical protein
MTAQSDSWFYSVNQGPEGLYTPASNNIQSIPLIQPHLTPTSEAAAPSNENGDYTGLMEPSSRLPDLPRLQNLPLIESLPIHSGNIMEVEASIEGGNVVRSTPEEQDLLCFGMVTIIESCFFGLYVLTSIDLRCSSNSNTRKLVHN